MRITWIVPCVFGLIVAMISSAPGGSISGQLFNLDGTPITGEEIAVQIVENGAELVTAKFSGGSYAFTISAPSPRKLDLLYYRRGVVTKTHTEVFVSDAQPLVLNTAVKLPEVPCCYYPTMLVYPQYSHHRGWTCRLGRW